LNLGPILIEKVYSSISPWYHRVEEIRTPNQVRVGTFKQSNTHKFTWFGNLPTPRSYWFVLMKLTNNTNKRRRKNSTQLNTLKLSLLFFLSVFSHTFHLLNISALHLSNYRQSYGKKSRPTITAKMVATYQPLTLAMQPCLTWLPTTICVHTQQYVVMPPPIPSCEATFMDHRAPISLAISGFCLCLIAAHISFSFSHLSTGLTSQETGTFSQETLIPLSFKKQ
jgi:hypothetical protein